MGTVLSLGRVQRIQVGKRGKRADQSDLVVRKRNSLAYNLEEFVKLKGADCTALIREIEMTIKANAPQIHGTKAKLNKVPKNTEIGNLILHGNMRQLKTQVIVNFNTINRRYKDVTHNGNGILHFVCQEGYYEMLVFITNKKNRPDLDKDLPLDLNMHNDKVYLYMYLCVCVYIYIYIYIYTLYTYTYVCICMCM
jgi:hypothetical protein